MWSTIPDEELLDLAVRGKLKDRDVLERQVQRMLRDERSKALVDNFASQWLQLRDLRSVKPDPDLFPDFDENLRDGLRQETELFIDSQLRENRSIVDLLTANYTFVNERLAQHYGIPGVYGERFRRVTLPDDRRGGLLGQASVLTVTSYPNRTSPVLRGKWLLENILGTPPPPPPPDVPALRDKGVHGERQSVRERLQEHRKSPACASCHAQMDPLGFALEHFDGVGKWRTTDEGRTAIDASGSLADGASFEGLAGLKVRAVDAARAVRRDGCGTAAGVRSWTEHRVLRQAGGTPDRSRRRRRRLPLVLDHPRNRRERAIPDAEKRVMIVMKKALPRRTILRGLGATLALPLLDSMVPAFAAAATRRPVNRLGVVYVPNGMTMQQWTPSAEGAGFEFTTVLKPLEPYRDRILVLSGLNSTPPPELSTAAGVHSRASTRFLTDVPPKRSDTSDVQAGVSVDQLVAKEFGRETQLASLELTIEGRDLAGSCDIGFSCAYTNTISWRGAKTPLPMEDDPRVVFERMFGRRRQHRPCRAARADRGRPQHSRFGHRRESPTSIGGLDRAIATS